MLDSWMYILSCNYLAEVNLIAPPLFYIDEAESMNKYNHYKTGGERASDMMN